MHLKEVIFAYLVYNLSPLPIGIVATLLVWFPARILWHEHAAPKINRLAETLLRPLVVLIIFGSITLIVLNALYPAYIWVNEPQSASVSYVLSQGFPLYHALDAPQRYSLLYGPVMYLLTAGIYKVFGASMVTAKLANNVLLLALVGFAGASLRRYASRPWLALAVFLLLLVRMLLVSSPLIILGVVVAFHLHYCTTWRFRAAAIGVCLGLATGVKFTSGIYFLPILIDLLFQKRIRDLFVLSLAAGTFTVLPFFLPGVDARNYLLWLKAAAAHGLSWHFFVMVIEWLAYQMSVVLALLLVSPRERSTEAITFPSRSTWWGAAGAVGLALIVASKAGAGTQHLYPLIPSLVLLLPPVAEALRRWGVTKSWSSELSALSSVFLLSVMAFGLIPLSHTYYEILRVPGNAITSDLQKIMRSHPGARIALGDGESTLGEWQTKPPLNGRTAGPILIFAGMPLVYEPMAVMDMQESGLSLPPAMIEQLRRGDIDVWLFPKGREPFNIVNWYDYKTPVFPQEFRDAFFAHYEPAGSSMFYDLWKFRGSHGPTEDPLKR